MTCDLSHFQEQDSGLFLRHLKARSKPFDFPFTASMEWTARCNLRCIHCYVTDEHERAPHPAAGQLRSLLDLLARHEVLFLVITGGEPLIRPDFAELYAYARNLGFVITLFTNGTLLNDQTVDLLVRLPPRRVEVSLYGMSPETYEAVTGVADGFERCKTGVEALVRRGALVEVKSVIMKQNRHEFEAMRDWAAGLGCHFRYDPLIHCRLNGDPVPTLQRLDPEAVAQLQFSNEYDRDQFLEYRRRLDGIGPQQRLFECGAGTQTIHIDGEGKAHPCIIWHGHPFDLLRQSIDREWDAHIRSVREAPAPAGECAECRNRGLCGCCPAISSLETGDPGKRVQYYCDLAAVRAETPG